MIYESPIYLICIWVASSITIKPIVLCVTNYILTKNTVKL